MIVLQFDKYLVKIQSHENNIAPSEFDSKQYPAGESGIHREMVEWLLVLITYLDRLKTLAHFDPRV